MNNVLGLCCCLKLVWELSSGFAQHLWLVVPLSSSFIKVHFPSHPLYSALFTRQLLFVALYYLQPTATFCRFFISQLSFLSTCLRTFPKEFHCRLSIEFFWLSFFRGCQLITQFLPPSFDTHFGGLYFCLCIGASSPLYHYLLLLSSWYISITVLSLPANNHRLLVSFISARNSL